MSRHADCDRCHSKSEAKRVAYKRLARRDRLIGRTCRALAQADELHDIKRLACNLMDRFRGPRGLAQALHETIQAARPGSTIVANSLLAVMKIQLLAESASHDAAMPVTLESRRAALTREFSDFLLEQIQERPSEYAELLRAAGWRVEPPEAPEQTAD